MPRPRLLTSAFGAFLLLIPSAWAKVERVEITATEVLLNGQPFGAAGAYERISGRLHLAVDPSNSYNQAVVDLGLAKRNPQGQVEFSADFALLRPVAADQGNGSVLLEICNRGTVRMLSVVQGAAASEHPSTPADFGDGWLMRQGYTLAWVGWEWDAQPVPGFFRLQAPIAYGQDGRHLEGLLRDDFSLALARPVVPLGHLINGVVGGREYPVSDPSDPRNRLTVRDTPEGPRLEIPREQWQFSPDRRAIRLAGGFAAGRIYELVYAVQDPVVAGLGFAAVRDFISYLKYDADRRLDRAYAMGISQCGRFLRQYLAEGFDADEQGRETLDGVIAHVGGAGQGSFNIRFAQPSRDAEPRSAFFYPTDLFPFTAAPETDPETRATGGLLDALQAEHLAPKIFLSNTSYEYWGRSAALIHVSPDGARDVGQPENVRVYFLAGFQHSSAPFPPRRGVAEANGQDLPNHNPIQWSWRAMIANLDAWVRAGVAPPPSNPPTLRAATLVPLARWTFPSIPGVHPPHEATVAWRLDFGPGWPGRIDFEPPKVGAPFPVFVPQVDADGNDLAGVHDPELAVPVATYTGWNLRNPAIGAPGSRVAFLGSFLPFARTAEARQRSGDPRPSLAERYAGKDDYLARYRKAAEELVRQRWLLADDVPAVMERGAAEWDLVAGTAP
jgi:hypothetical protein